MIVRDAHVHLSDQAPFSNAVAVGQEVEGYLELRASLSICDSLVVGYERASHRGNNEEVLALASKIPGLHPLAFAETLTAIDAAIFTDAQSLGYAGWALYLDDSGVERWSTDTLTQWKRSAPGILSVNCPGGNLLALRKALSALPDIPILVSHLGQPGRQGDGRETLLALARDPRIYVKASAFYAIDPSPDHLDAREHTARVIEAFGPSRIMWGSDFSPALDSPGFSLVPPWFKEMLGSDAADVMGATLGALLQIIGRASMTTDHK